MQSNEIQSEMDGTLSAREAEQVGAFREDALSLNDAEESKGDDAMSLAEIKALIDKLRTAEV